MATKTPPTKAPKAAAPKSAAPKEPKEKKPRAPRQDYGFHKLATIRVTKFDEGKEKKYRGLRADWYTKLQAADGKTVETFLKANEGKDPPRGWLRFFIQDGAATLDASTVPAEKPAKEEAPVKAAASAS